MNILITNISLNRLTGTELIVDELARELTNRGHRVTAFTPRPGRLAQDLSSAGIQVVSSPADIPADIDIIHGQHHLPTMIALAALPEVPAIYFLHGYAPWEEQPPLHPRIRTYLCAAPRLRNWLHYSISIPQTSTALVPNWVDIDRFSKTRTPDSTPSKAVVFTNDCTPNLFGILESACKKRGITLSKLGNAFDRETESPERSLPMYDIAFASGRSALEAMASGCAVIPFRDGRIAPLITPATFNESAERNFTVEPDAAPMDIAQAISEIKTYSRKAAMETTFRIRRDFNYPSSVDLLERHYESAVSNSESSSPTAESSCLASYLSDLAAREMELANLDALRTARLKTGWDKTKRKREFLADAVGVAHKKLQLVDKHLSRGLFRQSLRQRIRAGWKEIEGHANRVSEHP